MVAWLVLAQMLEMPKGCSWKGYSVYFGPPGMMDAPDALSHNNCDGTFTAVTDKDLPLKDLGR